MKAGDQGRAAFEPFVEDPRLRGAILAARSGNDRALIHALSQGGVQDALRDPRHVAATAHAPVPDAGAEALWTALRRLNLMTVMRRSGGLPSAARLDGDVVAVVARQCFLAGYIFPETSEEADALRELSSLLAGDPTATGLEGYDLSCGLPPAYLAYATYRPLSTLAAASRLGAITPDALSPAQAELLLMQVREPADEAHLAVEVDPPESTRPAAAPYWHEDGDVGFRAGLGVSRERPSPRWRIAGSAHRGDRDLFFRRPLVAGCGTGQRAVALAESSADARVLAVDPDRRALAYGWRMARDAGLGNLRFRRADIADMAGWPGERFDLIDATGLAARLADVETGLAVLKRLLVADGVLCFDLPSLTGQRHLMAARALAEREDTSPPWAMSVACGRGCAAFPATHLRAR